MTIRTPDPALREYLIAEMELESGRGRSNSLIDSRIRPNPSTTRFGRMLQENPNMVRDLSDAIVERSDGKFLFTRLYLSAIRLQHQRVSLAYRPPITRSTEA